MLAKAADLKMKCESLVPDCQALLAHTGVEGIQAAPPRLC